MRQRHTRKHVLRTGPISQAQRRSSFKVYIKIQMFLHCLGWIALEGARAPLLPKKSKGVTMNLPHNCYICHRFTTSPSGLTSASNLNPLRPLASAQQTQGYGDPQGNPPFCVAHCVLFKLAETRHQTAFFLFWSFDTANWPSCRMINWRSFLRHTDSLFNRDQNLLLLLKASKRPETPNDSDRKNFFYGTKGQTAS